jgi:glutamate synthase domain-containing protein 1
MTGRSYGSAALCGISGIFHKHSSIEHPADVGAELVKMLESMTHRGKDSSGIIVAGQPTDGDLIVCIWTSTRPSGSTHRTDFVWS